MAWQCPDCGSASNFGTPAGHRCNMDKYAAHQADQVEPALTIFLTTDQGRFMTFYARWLINGQGIPQSVAPGEVQP